MTQCTVYSNPSSNNMCFIQIPHLRTTDVHDVHWPISISRSKGMRVNSYQTLFPHNEWVGSGYKTKSIIILSSKLGVQWRGIAKPKDMSDLHIVTRYLP